MKMKHSMSKGSSYMYPSDSSDSEGEEVEQNTALRYESPAYMPSPSDDGSGGYDDRGAVYAQNSRGILTDDDDDDDLDEDEDGSDDEMELGRLTGGSRYSTRGVNPIYDDSSPSNDGNSTPRSAISLLQRRPMSVTPPSARHTNVSNAGSDVHISSMRSPIGSSPYKSATRLPPRDIDGRGLGDVLMSLDDDESPPPRQIHAGGSGRRMARTRFDAYDTDDDDDDDDESGVAHSPDRLGEGLAAAMQDGRVDAIAVLVDERTAQRSMRLAHESDWEVNVSPARYNDDMNLREVTNASPIVDRPHVPGGMSPAARPTVAHNPVKLDFGSVPTHTATPEKGSREAAAAIAAAMKGPSAQSAARASPAEADSDPLLDEPQAVNETNKAKSQFDPGATVTTVLPPTSQVSEAPVATQATSARAEPVLRMAEEEQHRPDASGDEESGGADGAVSLVDEQSGDAGCVSADTRAASLSLDMEEKNSQMIEEVKQLLEDTRGRMAAVEGSLFDVLEGHKEYVQAAIRTIPGRGGSGLAASPSGGGGITATVQLLGSSMLAALTIACVSVVLEFLSGTGAQSVRYAPT